MVRAGGWKGAFPASQGFPFEAKMFYDLQTWKKSPGSRLQAGKLESVNQLLGAYCGLFLG